MSGIVATRTALAGALSDVDGVRGYVYAPTVYKPGDAWAQWAGAEPPEGGRYRNNFVHSFRVIIILPVDAETSDSFVDGHLDALVDAIAPTLTVSSIGSASLPGDGTQAAFKALVITGETE
jgi:hypothetical protein